MLNRPLQIEFCMLDRGGLYELYWMSAKDKGVTWKRPGINPSIRGGWCGNVVNESAEGERNL